MLILTYIYIYIYLLIYYLSAFTVTKKKKKKTPEFKDNNISNHCLGKKEKDYQEKKRKKRPTSSHQLKKIKRYTISWSKEQIPTAKCCNATITKRAQY